MYSSNSTHIVNIINAGNRIIGRRIVRCLAMLNKRARL